MPVRNPDVWAIAFLMLLMSGASLAQRATSQAARAAAVFPVERKVILVGEQWEARVDQALERADRALDRAGERLDERSRHAGQRLEEALGRLEQRVHERILDRVGCRFAEFFR